MFKVECLGCQAPYQVDERRVPEKGLKMRCPKCGTSFRVEPPTQGGASTDATATPLEASEGVAAPVSSPRPFSSGGLEPGKGLVKPPGGGGRDPLSRTMIGVSAADLGLGSVGEPPKPKGFRIPRPGAGAPGTEPALAAATPASSARSAAFATPDDPDTDLSFEPPAPASAADQVVEAWIGPDSVSDAPPESLVEPSSPLRLSELPQPVAAPNNSPHTQPTMQFSKAASVQPNAFELDYGDDLPVATAAGKKPPPRRPRPPGRAASPSPSPSPRPSPLPDSVDLPARLEDLEVSLPKAVSPAAPRSSDRAARPRPSSLDELDLPAIPGREGVAALPSPRQARRNAVETKPGVAPRAAKPAPHSSDLPAVSGAAAARARRPTVSDLPDVLGAGLPDILAAGLPDVAHTGLPDVLAAGLPDVARAGLPMAVAAGLPDVARAGLPVAVAAGLPDVAGAALPDVLRAGLPALSPTGLPEVSGRGVAGFGRVDLPVAQAGLPEVRAPGIGSIDLPSVGDALPSLAGEAWGEASLPLVGGPASDGDPFGEFGMDQNDPFAGSEADFGSPAEQEDPFAGTAGDDFGAAGIGESPEPRSGGAYGEVDIGDGPHVAAPIETEDMEFNAIPQRQSSPPGPGRAAAHANVHAEGADAETAGSTLELGPERRAVPRRRSKRIAAALAICAAAIAGGALSLEPRLGPFGVHFILDQVHRAEHEKLLARLIDEARRGSAEDTLDAATRVLGQLEAARQTAPRFDPLTARSAFTHYDVALRFGPLPKLEATAKTAIERLAPGSSAAGDRLARAARSMAESSKDAQRELELLGPDPDARQLLGELALRALDWQKALEIWQSLAKTDAKSARIAFGLARAELGLGNASEARSRAQGVLSSSPGHVGARILLLEAQRALGDAGVKSTPEDSSTETLMANLVQALPHASPGEAALAHTVLGEVHLAQGRAAPAQQSFEEALSVDRNFPRALVGLGETLELGSRHAEALARFEAAVHAQTGWLPAELGMAKAQIQLQRLPEAQIILKRLLEKLPGQPTLLYWQGRAEQAAGDPDAALASYAASIQASKGRADSVDAYLALARLQAELGQLAVAQQTLGEAQEKLPASGALYKALGEMAMTRAEYTRAYEQFQSALGLDSGDTRARFLGAVALTRLGRFDEALSAFASVGESDKDFPGLAVERGRLFEESGRNEQALSEYEAAFAKSPDDPEVQVRVGCSRVVAGRGADAEALLEKALKERPRSAEANHCLGRALFEQDRAMEALPRLERAINLDPSRAVYHLYLGWIQSELGRLSEASTALEQALELDKGLADAYWQRGRIRQKQGAVKDAIRDLERALALKPARTEALADLATAYADLGKMSNALKAWEDAIARDADNPTWHFRYAKLLSSSGSGAMAAAHLRRAIDLINEAKSASVASKPKPPPWLWQAHYLLARETGAVSAAIPHWQAYLRLGPADDPYRSEAQKALAALGQPWDPN